LNKDKCATKFFYISEWKYFSETIALSALCPSFFHEILCNVNLSFIFFWVKLLELAGNEEFYMKKVLILGCLLSVIAPSSVLAEGANAGAGYEAHKAQIQAQKQKLEQREQALDQRYQEHEAFKAKSQAMRQEHQTERQQLMEQRPQKAK
jgi:hypothetical protein